MANEKLQSAHQELSNAESVAYQLATDRAYLLCNIDLAEQNYDAFESELAIKNLSLFIANYPTSVYKKKAIYYLAKSYKDIGNSDSALVYFERVKREGSPANYEDALIELSSLYVKGKVDPDKFCGTPTGSNPGIRC